MASNYVQPGKTIKLVAPYDRTTGQGALVGSQFGVALQTVLSTVEGEFATEGVWALAKTAAQSWAQGDQIYWNTSTKLCDNVPTTGPLIGVATAVAANPSSTGVVRLNGSAAFSTPGLGLSAAELAVLDGAGTGGTPVASKAQIADANQNIGAVKATSVSIGASGAEVALTATPAELNALASATSGLGSSNSYAKTDNGVKTLLAAHATKDRGVLVVVTIDENFADGGGNQTVVKIGETDTDDKCMAVGVLVGATAGAKYIFGFTNTATKAIIATITAAVGAGTGGVSILVLALPNS